MALTTLCPHCQTAFRVANDQLKLRAGLVRCGACQKVFNGLEHLAPDAAPTVAIESPAPRGLEYLAPEAGAPAAAIESPAVRGPEHLAPAVAPAAAIESPAVPPTSLLLASEILTPPADNSFEAELASGASSPALPPRRVTSRMLSEVFEEDAWATSAAAQSEPRVVQALVPISEAPPAEVSVVEALPAEAPEYEAPPAETPATETPPAEVVFSEAPSADVVFSDALPAEVLFSEALPVEATVSEARAAEATVSEVPPAEATVSKAPPADIPAFTIPVFDAPAMREASAGQAVLYQDDVEEPGFVTRARRAQRTGGAVRTAMTIGSGILLLALLLQSAAIFRHSLSASFPRSAPVLQGICAMLGCRPGLPAQIDAVSIESSELQQSATQKDTLTVAILLRNRSATAQTWPNIELSLNDANEKTMVRRVFVPGEYLSAPKDAPTGMAATSEQSVRLLLDVGQLKPSGYRVYLFYP